MANATAHPDLAYLEAHYPPALVDFMLTGADDIRHATDALELVTITARTAGAADLVVVATLDHVRTYADDITAAGFELTVVIPARAAA